MRFGGYVKKDFQSVVTHLCPYPRIHWVTPSKAPHVSPDQQNKNASVEEIIEAAY